ncbi:MerR family DNA-binding transcriptional regulator [Micromonospora zamorensis]
MTARTGVPQRLLRYYEEQQLVTPGRDVNGYRVYCE